MHARRNNPSPDALGVDLPLGRDCRQTWRVLGMREMGWCQSSIVRTTVWTAPVHDHDHDDDHERRRRAT